MMTAMQEGEADMAFARGMIAQHQRAIEMAKTGLKQGKDPEMCALAQTSIKAQRSEIDQMQHWLKQQKK